MRMIIIRTIALIIIFLFSTDGFSQQAAEWMKMLNTPYDSFERLKQDNAIDQYLTYDFSTLFVPRSPFLGYIGNDFRRLNIFFTSVSKDDKDATVYLISGISLVGKNKCIFQGSVKIQEIREYENLHYGADDQFKNSGIRAEGALIGRYKFDETPGQPNSGIFAGIMTLYWVVDKNGIIHSDHIEYYSDGYKNNQYVGSWTAHDRKREVVANWGEDRIPFSEKLDIGAAYFSADPKYKNKGWGEMSLP